MISIEADEFSLRLELRGRHGDAPGQPYMDWLDLDVYLGVPGIEAHAAWSVMPAELIRFRDGLQDMAKSLRPKGRAELSGVERSFRLALSMQERGAILGDFRVQPTPPDGPRVEGQFGIDQTHLPAILEGIEMLLGAS